MSQFSFGDEFLMPTDLAVHGGTAITSWEDLYTIDPNDPSLSASERRMVLKKSLYAWF